MLVKSESNMKNLCYKTFLAGICLVKFKYVTSVKDQTPLDYLNILRNIFYDFLIYLKLDRDNRDSRVLMKFQNVS